MKSKEYEGQEEKRESANKRMIEWSQGHTKDKIKERNESANKRIKKINDRMKSRANERQSKRKRDEARIREWLNELKTIRKTVKKKREKVRIKEWQNEIRCIRKTKKKNKHVKKKKAEFMSTWKRKKRELKLAEK